jgi:predicted TIM-barrel fold metal-dependent hydrolase
VLDVNTAFGRLPVAGPDCSLPALRRLMDRNGVAAAVTSSLVGLTYHDAEGNAETLRACRTDPRLHPAAVVMPGVYLDWRRHLEAALAAGCRVVKLYPEEHGWSPRSRRFEELVAFLAARPAPPALLLASAPPADLADYARATAGSGVALVPAGVHYATLGEGLALLQRHEHVLLETSRAASPGTVALIVQEAGPDRLLFGSGAPARPVAPALNAVLGAPVSAAARAAILAGNLSRLLGVPVDSPDAAPGTPVASAYRGYRGPIVDVHTHLGAGTWRFPIPSAGAAGLRAVLREAGIGRAIASSIFAITTDLREGNDRLAAALSAAPDDAPQLYGYVTVNPQHPAASAAELARFADHPRMVGVKIHAEYSRTPTSAPAMRRLFAEVARFGRPVKIHNAGADWMPALAALAEAHPALPIIVAHGGGWGAGPYFRDRPNVHFEFCSSGPEQGVIAECLQAVGPRRVLFGSDADLISPLYVLGAYTDAGIADADAPLVYAGNAERLFGL